MLRKLYVDGPRSDGVFRKSANHAKLISVKQSLDCGESVNFDEIPVTLAAVLLKVWRVYTVLPVFYVCGE